MSYRDDLKAFVDGELPEERAKEIRSAIGRDPDLASEAEVLTQLTSAFKAIPAPQPHGLEQTLWALQRSTPKPSPRPWPWFLGLGLAGAGALVMMINTLGGARESADYAVAGESATMAADSSAASAPATERMAPDNMVAKAEAPKTLDLGLESDDTKSTTQPVIKKRQLPTSGRVKSESSVTPKKEAQQKPKTLAAPQPAAGGTTLSAPAAVAMKADPLSDTTIVELRVPSIDIATAAIRQMADENQSTLLEQDLMDQKKPTLTMDVPKAKLDELVKKLKDLPKELETGNQTQFARAQQNQQSSQNQSGAQGGGFAQGPRGDLKAKSEAIAQGVAKTERRKIRIVFVTTGED